MSTPRARLIFSADGGLKSRDEPLLSSPLGTILCNAASSTRLQESTLWVLADGFVIDPFSYKPVILYLDSTNSRLEGHDTHWSIHATPATCIQTAIEKAIIAVSPHALKKPVTTSTFVLPSLALAIPHTEACSFDFSDSTSFHTVDVTLDHRKTNVFLSDNLHLNLSLGVLSYPIEPSNSLPIFSRLSGPVIARPTQRSYLFTMKSEHATKSVTVSSGEEYRISPFECELASTQSTDNELLVTTCPLFTDVSIHVLFTPPGHFAIRCALLDLVTRFARDSWVIENIYIANMNCTYSKLFNMPSSFLLSTNTGKHMFEQLCTTQSEFRSKLSHGMFDQLLLSEALSVIAHTSKNGFEANFSRFPHIMSMVRGSDIGRRAILRVLDHNNISVGIVDQLRPHRSFTELGIPNGTTLCFYLPRDFISDNITCTQTPLTALGRSTQMYPIPVDVYTVYIKCRFGSGTISFFFFEGVPLTCSQFKSEILPQLLASAGLEYDFINSDYIIYDIYRKEILGLAELPMDITIVQTNRKHYEQIDPPLAESLHSAFEIKHTFAVAASKAEGDSVEACSTKLDCLKDLWRYSQPIENFLFDPKPLPNGLMQTSFQMSPDKISELSLTEVSTTLMNIMTKSEPPAKADMTYDVEYICARKPQIKSRYGRATRSKYYPKLPSQLFLIHWEGFGDEARTWEPERNLINAVPVRAFDRVFGRTNEESVPGILDLTGAEYAKVVRSLRKTTIEELIKER